jgi:hypothetical protein
MLWDIYPLPGAGQRLEEIPTHNARFDGTDVSLTASERAAFGPATVVHRRYWFNGRVFFLTVIDGARNRHAVHDPRYCFQGAGWRITTESRLQIPGGAATWFKMDQAAEHGEVVFWFSDGATRHSSLPWYWWQTTLRRLTLGRCGADPVMVVLQSYGADPPAWTVLVKDLVADFRL